MWLRGLFGAGFIAGMAGACASIAPGGPAPAAAPGADDGAAVVAERSPGPRLLDLTVRSPVLAGTADVRLLLPPGWSRDAGRTWPVLYLLHGGGADHTAWTANTAVERIAGQHGVLVVMPDGGACGNYSDWWNRGGGGPPGWETFHLAELRQILERGYGAGTERAIAGAGMGGTGALAYAARHRGLFRAAASFSGALNTLHHDPGGLDGPDLIELGVAVGAPAATWTDLWGRPDEQRMVWRHHNPYDLADRLAGTRLYVSSGDGTPGPYDPYAGADAGRGPGPGRGPDVVEALAHRVALQFTGKLRRLGIPASSHFYQGTHTWPYWERELNTALPLLLAEIT
ncbi:alpha/beta hydrolase [Actinomadura viridis]|uniref:alpha/beta hydrolase n=1 Tax=Actinomadura viridis TaxID=58110 RepID=UPI00367C0597